MTDPPRSKLNPTKVMQLEQPSLSSAPHDVAAGVPVESGGENSPDSDGFVVEHPKQCDEPKQDGRNGRPRKSSGELITSADEAELLTRMPLGDFRLTRAIGRGGMGVVYEAQQLSLGRTLAVKVLPFASMLDEQQRRRFHNEARAAATLDHPNIVPIYFVGQERGVHFYAMQLIEGQSLAEIIADLGRQKTTPPGQHPTIESFSSVLDQQRTGQKASFFRSAARLGQQAANALAHAHDVGIVHRDVKPGNLLVDASSKLRMTDFGLAIFDYDEHLTATGGIVGTVAYMSPEQAAGSRMVDPRSDIYSLGVTLHELLGPERRNAEATTRSGLTPNRKAELTPLRKLDPGIPVDLETIVLKAVAPDPADRYQTATAMEDDLRRFGEGREFAARRLTIIERTLRILSRYVLRPSLIRQPVCRSPRLRSPWFRHCRQTSPGTLTTSIAKSMPRIRRCSKLKSQGGLPNTSGRSPYKVSYGPNKAKHVRVE